MTLSWAVEMFVRFGAADRNPATYAAAAHAVMTVRTPQGTIAWVLALVTFPYLAVPLYWVFGRDRFHGYRQPGLRGTDALEQVVRRATDALRPLAPPPAGAGRALPFEPRLAELPPTVGNRVELLVDGRATFDAIFAAIGAARSYVLVEFFLVRDDDTGRALRKRLADAAARGVRVYVLYDSFGSRTLSRGYVRGLRGAGARVEPFRSTTRRIDPFQVNFRNHRKLVVVDGRVAFTGGLNVGDEYVTGGPRFESWRDTHARATGPVVQAMQLAFVEDWFWITGEVPDLEWTPEPVAKTTEEDEPQISQTNAEAPDSNLRNLRDLRLASSSADAVDVADGCGMIALAIATGPVDEIDVCSLAIQRLINTARRRLWIASPYLVPDPPIVAALQLAAIRGADVRILLPSRPDHLLPFLSSYSYYDVLRPAGVRVFRYGPGFMHQKVMLIDDAVAAVGSVNLDVRSFHLNFELALAVADAGFAKDVERMLEADFARAVEEDLAKYRTGSRLFRAKARLARMLAPIQ
jgi:cardiolipin synthase A/B